MGYDVCAAQEESEVEQFSADAPPAEEATVSGEGRPDSPDLGPDLWSGGMDAPCTTSGAPQSPMVVAFDGCGREALNSGLAGRGVGHTRAWCPRRAKAKTFVVRRRKVLGQVPADSIISRESSERHLPNSPRE